MRQRSRLLLVLKWLGTTACILLAAGYLASYAWYLDVERRQWAFVAGSGVVWLAYSEDRGQLRDPFETAWDIMHHRWTWTWALTRAPATGHLLELSLCGPAWPILLVAATPTAALWWLDRRRHGPGRCTKCGYNLTGDVSGVCPECGETR